MLRYISLIEAGVIVALLWPGRKKKGNRSWEPQHKEGVKEGREKVASLKRAGERFLGHKKAAGRVSLDKKITEKGGKSSDGKDKNRST